MSEQDIKPEGTESEQELAQSPESPTQPESKEEAKTEPKAKLEQKPLTHSAPRKSWSGLVMGFILFLLIAVVAAAALGAYYWLWPQYQAEQRAQMQKIEQMANQVSQDLNAAQAQNRELLQRNQRQQQALSLFQAQLKELEAAQRQLRQMNQSPPEQWVLAEADYLVRLAGQRLWIEGDVTTSIALLVSADERIASLHDASLVPLRRALNRDIQALRSLPKLDIEGITLTLDGLIAQIDRMPIKSLEIPDSIRTKEIQEISDDPSDWLANIKVTWETFKEDFIQVDRISDVSPLISPEQRWFLVNNTKLKLQQAQLAALRAQPEHFRNSLSQVSELLKDYFVEDSSSVLSARQTIAELSIKPVELELPAQFESASIMLEALSLPRKRSALPGADSESTEESAL